MTRFLLHTAAPVVLAFALCGCAETRLSSPAIYSSDVPPPASAVKAPAGKVIGASNVYAAGNEQTAKTSAKTPAAPKTQGNTIVAAPKETAEHHDPLPPRLPGLGKGPLPKKSKPLVKTATPPFIEEPEETPAKAALELAARRSSVGAKPHGLRLEDVTNSAEQHYPEILRAQASSAASEGKVQEKQGAYDWEWKQKYSSRIYGEKYDGTFMEHRVQRRTPGSAATIYGGYTVSGGAFPVYEQEYKAEDAGELNVGAMVSLWRDRIIDAERAALKDAELELAQKRASQLLARLTARFEATVRYLDWLAAGYTLQTLQDQLALAEHRQSAFEKRVRYGDLAEIYLTENRQNLLKRKAYIAEAKRKFEDAAVKLSLYYRDSQGRTILPQESDLPAHFPEGPAFAAKGGAYAEEIERARSIRPEKIVLTLEEQRTRTQLALSRNQLLPKVDLTAEASQGFNELSQKSGEAKIGLSVVIPLQQNKAGGAVRRTEAELEQIKQRQKLLDDQIAAEIQYIANRMHAAEQTIGLAEQETEAAEAMRRAEQIRFEHGEADFFVLNMREEKVAQAKIELIDARAERLKAIAGYDLATLRIRPN